MFVGKRLRRLVAEIVWSGLTLGLRSFEFGFQARRIAREAALLQEEIAQLFLVLEVDLGFEQVRLNIYQFRPSFGINRGFQIRNAQQAPPSVGQQSHERPFVLTDRVP